MGGITRIGDYSLSRWCHPPLFLLFALCPFVLAQVLLWIPAFAGMTVLRPPSRVRESSLILLAFIEARLILCRFRDVTNDVRLR